MFGKQKCGCGLLCHVWYGSSSAYIAVGWPPWLGRSRDKKDGMVAATASKQLLSYDSAMILVATGGSICNV